MILFLLAMQIYSVRPIFWILRERENSWVSQLWVRERERVVKRGQQKQKLKLNGALI